MVITGQSVPMMVQSGMHSAMSMGSAGEQRGVGQGSDGDTQTPLFGGTASGALTGFSNKPPYSFQAAANTGGSPSTAAMAIPSLAATAVPSLDQLLRGLTPEQARMVALLRAFTIASGGHDLVCTLATPRVGGRSAEGVWTGRGLCDDGLNPFSHYCMRDYFKIGLKEHSTLGDIQEHCMEGLKGPKFCMPYEKDAGKLVPTVKALQRFVQNHGMEGVFAMILPSVGALDLFQHPAMASERMICTWIQDLTGDGI